MTTSQAHNVPPPATARRTGSRESASPGLKIPHISIRHGNPGAPQQQSASAASANSAARNKPFSDEALIQAWDKYMATHPHAHILINTMRAASPHRTAPERFAITVQNQIQLSLMDESRRDIMDFIHDELDNDLVDFDLHINKEASPRHTLTDPELLEKMKSEAPVLCRLIDDFKLHLA